MKKEEISALMSETDPVYIEEAMMVTKKKNKLIYIGVSAACFSLVMTAVMLAGGISGAFTALPEKGEKETTKALAEDFIETPGGEMAVMPQWDDLTVTMKFSEAEINGAVYYAKNHSTQEENVGEFIGETTVYGYDIYEDKSYSERAVVYSVRGISSQCAVIVRIGEDEGNFIYVNAEYMPETLGQLLDDLRLLENIRFGKAYSNFITDREHTDRVYDDSDDSVIINMLFSDKSLEAMTDVDIFSDIVLSISTDIPLLGYENISVGVSEDGYLVTNILETQKCFFIGGEKASEIVGYYEDNVKYTDRITVFENPDGSVAGKEEPVVVTPGYNPFQ